MDLWGMRLSPDGKQLAFHADSPGPVRSYAQPDLWLLDLPSQQLHNLTAAYDFDMGSGVSGDNGSPAGGGSGGIQWHGNQLLDLVARQGKALLVSVDPETHSVTELTHGNQAVQAYDRATDGTIVTKISTPTQINEIARLDGQPLTQLNLALFDKLDLTVPEEINYRSLDGRTIQAWLQKPPDFDPSRKYPLILNIHGGPHAAYGWVFDHEFQAAAARGYLVLYPNPRGSTSYGQEFGNLIQYRYPGDDYLDLMAGVDAVLARGFVHDKQLAVTGGSGGGLLTNWTVSHTQRFAAGVAQRDISDWASWWYTADLVLFRPSWFQAPPFENPSEYARRSPITYVQNITTPMMFLVGDEDTRTPPESGGEPMFRALKYLRRPTVLVRFPRENHDLSRSGEPRHRVERLDHILGWFDKWLRKISRPEYDP
jgi:dipeptidyl aminopeptidase/acylaminoacyl peptidase